MSGVGTLCAITHYRAALFDHYSNNINIINHDMRLHRHLIMAILIENTDKNSFLLSKLFQYNTVNIGPQSGEGKEEKTHNLYWKNLKKLICRLGREFFDSCQAITLFTAA